MISARFVGDNAAQNRLTIRGNAATSGVTRAAAKLGIDLQNVRRNKLSDRVPKVRSGSAKPGIAIRTERGGAGITATLYADASYAAAQEYGFTGRVNVRASLRRTKTAFRHPIAATADSVGAYSPRMVLPQQRSFLRSTLDDMAMDIGKGIRRALHEALK